MHPSGSGKERLNYILQSPSGQDKGQRALKELLSGREQLNNSPLPLGQVVEIFNKQLGISLIPGLTNIMGLNDMTKEWQLVEPADEAKKKDAADYLIITGEGKHNRDLQPHKATKSILISKQGDAVTDIRFANVVDCDDKIKRVVGMHYKMIKPGEWKIVNFEVSTNGFPKTEVIDQIGQHLGTNILPLPNPQYPYWSAGFISKKMVESLGVGDSVVSMRAMDRGDKEGDRIDFSNGIARQSAYFQLKQQGIGGYNFTYKGQQILHIPDRLEKVQR